MDSSSASKTNWPAFILLGLFVVVVVVVLSVTLFNSKTTSNKGTTNKTATATVASGKVIISASGFSPATISVKKGSTVTWTNQDTKVHQVVSDPHPSHTLLPDLDSSTLSSGDSYTFTFEKVGKFTYHDENNPLTIKGEVDVRWTLAI